jgi:hypothetical protein
MWACVGVPVCPCRCATIHSQREAPRRRFQTTVATCHAPRPRPVVLPRLSLHLMSTQWYAYCGGAMPE